MIEMTLSTKAWIRVRLRVKVRVSVAILCTTKQQICLIYKCNRYSHWLLMVIPI